MNMSKKTPLTALCSVLVSTACSTLPQATAIPPNPQPVLVDEQGPVSQEQAQSEVEQAAQQAPNPEVHEDLLKATGFLSEVPLYQNNRAELLVDGPATYAAMQVAIAGAKSHIFLETYIFADDEVGQKFAQTLMKKAAEGVEVRIIYDSIGSIGSKNDFFRKMEDSGIRLIEFNRLNPLAGGNPLKANTRDHRKLLTVDGRVAFTGGLNYSSTYSSSSPRHPTQIDLSDGWRDTHVAILGPAVEGFERIFEQQWLSQDGTENELEKITPETGRQGDELVAVMQSQGGDGRESAIYRAYLEAIDRAEDRIWITQAYFAPDKQFITSLQQAAIRGVDVRVLVPGFTDSSLVLNASRSRYGKLLKHGVKIYENTSSVLHAKTAVIDSSWSTVGSSNLDYRSFLHNDEINAIIFGKDFALQMERQFKADIKNSRAVTMQEWKKRPLGDKLKEFFSWTLEYWL